MRSAAVFFVYAGVVAAMVGVPAGLLLGAVNGALARTSASPAAGLVLALALAMPLGAVLPTLVLGRWSWLSALSAVCAGIAAESQVHVVLRRADRAEAEPESG